MFQSHRVRGFEIRELVGKRFEGAAETVVGGVVGGFLDAVAPVYGGGAVVGVGFVGCEVDFAKESWEMGC